jgi:hypothetical protein
MNWISPLKLGKVATFQLWEHSSRYFYLDNGSCLINQWMKRNILERQDNFKRVLYMRCIQFQSSWVKKIWKYSHQHHLKNQIRNGLVQYDLDQPTKTGKSCDFSVMRTPVKIFLFGQRFLTSYPMNVFVQLTRTRYLQTRSRYKMLKFGH